MPKRSQFALVSGLCVDVGERIDEFAIMDMESERLFFTIFTLTKKGNRATARMFLKDYSGAAG